MNVAAQYEKIKKVTEPNLDFNTTNKIVIQVGSATCENAAGAEKVANEFAKHIKASDRNDILIHRVGCTGRCSLEPIVSVFLPNQPAISYQEVNRQKAHDIFVSHIQNNKILYEYTLKKSIEEKDLKAHSVKKQLIQEDITRDFFNLYEDKIFYHGQTRIALRNAGLIDPLSLGEYIKHHGFKSLVKVLEKNSSDWVIEEVDKAKLSGRGGGGFPTATKWRFANQQKNKTRYIICNADEGDPGAFMDRSMLESDPFSVIEGIIIAGFAIGAQQGFIYIRAEYPLAVERLKNAITICRNHGLIGDNVLGSEFSFDLEIRLGAGAFVCGEETALINSIQGERGQPRVRPPFPAESGLWEKPTVVNNVETLTNIPVIIEIGGDKFSQMGNTKHGGTKVFALAGKVKNTGLIEVPIGTTIREIIFDIGGGIPNDKKLKAVQTGGPAGGFIPLSEIDVSVDYDSLRKMGSIMGSGGMIVLDEDDCMVDIAKFYLSFIQDESCGKCTPCREGTKRMLEILEKIAQGKADMKDLAKLERLAILVQKSSLCGLGRAAPNPVLSGLQYFRDEFIAHITDKKCPAKKCAGLISYEIDQDKCVGCTACARVCPVNCISGERKIAHKIDQQKCIKCGSCFNACRFSAIKRK